MTTVGSQEILSCVSFLLFDKSRLVIKLPLSQMTSSDVFCFTSKYVSWFVKHQRASNIVFLVISKLVSWLVPQSRDTKPEVNADPVKEQKKERQS